MASNPPVVEQILRKHGRRALMALAGRLPVCVWEAAWTALERMLVCRTPEGGFVRLRCDSCGHLKTIAFSCKNRLCLSCGWLYAQQFIQSGVVVGSGEGDDAATIAGATLPVKNISFNILYRYLFLFSLVQYLGYNRVDFYPFSQHDLIDRATHS